MPLYLFSSRLSSSSLPALPTCLASPLHPQCCLAQSSSLAPFPPGHSCSLAQVFVMCSMPFHGPLSSAQYKAMTMCDNILAWSFPTSILLFLLRPQWASLQLVVGKEDLLNCPPPLHLKGLKVLATASKKSVFVSSAQLSFPASQSQSGRQDPVPTVWLLLPRSVLVQSEEVLRLSVCPHHHLTSFFCVYFILFLWFLEQFKLPVYFHKRK